MKNAGNEEIYCPKCNTIHPTRMWHEYYENYLNREARIEKHKRDLKKLGIEYDDATYITYLEQKDLYATKKILTCVICNTPTGFISGATWHPVCSDVCKDMDKNKQIAVMKYARLNNKETILIKSVNREERKVIGVSIHGIDSGEVEVTFDEIYQLYDEICKAVTIE